MMQLPIRCAYIPVERAWFQSKSAPQVVSHAIDGVDEADDAMPTLAGAADELR